MKNLTRTLISLTFLTGLTYAQLTVDFGITLGSAKNDEITAVGIDTSGNTYVTGAFEDSIKVSESPDEYVKSAGWKDIFLAKYDANGDKAWAFSLGNERWDRGWSLAVSESGESYIGGVFGKDVDFDPGPNTTMLTSNSAGFWPDGYLAKYDTDGNLLWANHLLTARDRSASQSATLLVINDMHIDASNDLIIAGALWDTVWFSPTTMLVSQTALRDMFIAKYDANGTLKWAKTIPAGADQQIQNITTDPQGNIAVTGYIIGTADLDPGSGMNDYTSRGGQDIFVAKYDNNGNFLWGHGFGSEIDDEMGEGVGMDDNGNVYITGRFRDTVDFDPGVNKYTLTAGGLSDVFVLKLNPQGAFEWVLRLDGASNSTGKSIYVFPRGDFYVGGEYGSITGFDLDPGPDSSLITSLSGGSDMFAARYSTSGDFQYGWDLRGLDAEVLHDLEARGDVVVMGGSFTRTLLVDRQTGDLRFARGQNDMFVVRYGDNTTQNDRILLAQNLTLAPNPASHDVWITADWGTPFSVTLSLCDISGRVLQKHSFQKLTSIQHTMDLDMYRPGFYIVELLLPIGKQVCKLIIK